MNIADHDHAYIKEWQVRSTILRLIAVFQGEGEQGWEGINAKNAHLHGGAVSLFTL